MVFSSSLILLDLTEPVHVRHDSDLIIERIFFKRTSLSSVWNLCGGWSKDTFDCEFQCNAADG